MGYEVTLFIDGIHFGVAIKCSDGWYRFEYAAGGASGSFGSSRTTNNVTVKRSSPTGKRHFIGVTSKTLDAIIEFASKGSKFHKSKYDVIDNNCRHFASAMADFMGLAKNFEKVTKYYALSNLEKGKRFK